MSGIYKRTVFQDRLADGAVVLHDWARVNTGVGTMLEPFTPFAKTNFNDQFAAFEPADMMVRVDEMVPFSMGREMLLVGDTQLIGGRTWPRTGY